MNKRKGQRKHSVRRFTNRLDVDWAMTDGLYESACSAIRLQKEVGGCVPISFLKKTSNTRSLWIISIKNEHVIAVYDKIRKSIATFMPIEYKQELVDSVIDKEVI